MEQVRSREATTLSETEDDERDTKFLGLCSGSALQAAEILGWTVIPCVDAQGALRGVEEIHQQIWTLVQPLI